MNTIKTHIFELHFKSYIKIKFILLIYSTALIMAVKNNNIEIIKLLLANENIDVNIPYIFIFYYIKFIIIF